MNRADVQQFMPVFTNKCMWEDSLIICLCNTVWACFLVCSFLDVALKAHFTPNVKRKSETNQRQKVISHQVAKLISVRLNKKLIQVSTIEEAPVDGTVNNCIITPKTQMSFMRIQTKREQHVQKQLNTASRE